MGAVRVESATTTLRDRADGSEETERQRELAEPERTAERQRERERESLRRGTAHGQSEMAGWEPRTAVVQSPRAQET